MGKTRKDVNVEKDVRAVIAEILEVEPDEIDAKANFVKDLGMDSMMALEILASLEKKYGIAIPEDTLPKFTDLDTTIKLVEGLLTKK